MNETSIALLSILFGIAGANFTGLIFKKYSLGTTGNTLAGVFSSVFMIKSAGRFGIDPISIMYTGEPDLALLTLNMLASALAGLLGVVIAQRMKTHLLS